MTSDKIPSRTVMPCPFGGFGNDNIVQIGSVSGTDMNYPDGFPSAYGAPTENNGKFVLRKEMNALGKAATNDLFYHKCGGLNTFDADFCAAVGGYPKGAVLQMIDGYSVRSVMSLVDNNKVCFTGQTLTSAQMDAGLTNAQVDSVSWIYMNEDKGVGEVGTYNFSVTNSNSIIAAFVPSRSGIVSFDVNATTKVVENATQADSNVMPGLYGNNSAGLLMHPYSTTIDLPTISYTSSGTTTVVTLARASWNDWALVHGSIEVGSGHAKDPTSQIYQVASPRPSISDFEVYAGNTYLLSAVGGNSYIVNPTDKTISFYKVTYSGTVKVTLQ